MSDEKNVDGPWVTTVEDVGDGTGDVIIPIPDELLEKTGWDENTVLDIAVDDNGNIILREHK